MPISLGFIFCASMHTKSELNMVTTKFSVCNKEKTMLVTSFTEETYLGDGSKSKCFVRGKSPQAAFTLQCDMPW